MSKKRQIKKELILAFFILGIIVIILSISLIRPFSGNGNPDYEITNCTQLQEINNNLSASYMLVNDIDCYDAIDWNDGLGFEPIGDNLSYSFTGIFDGNGFKIINLQINRETNDIGLFAYSNGSIYNVHLENMSMRGDIHIGGLTAYNYGVIRDSYAEGIIIGNETVGGLVGENNGEIYNSFSEGIVTGSDFLGGLVGGNINGSIHNSYSNAEVISYDDQDTIGGLVGGNSGTINSSYATGEVNGFNYIGGLVGENGGHIYNSFSNGSVTGTDDSTYVGGLVGINGGAIAIIEDSHSTGEVNGFNYVGGLVGDNRGEIYNSFSNTNTTGNNYVGGLTGMNRLIKAYIKDSYSTGEVSGNNYVGGLVGKNQLTIEDSYSIIYVDGESYIGGLVGENNGSIDNSNSSGIIGTGFTLGGLVGKNEEVGIIKNSHSKGEVDSTEDNVGGLVGENLGEIYSSSANINITGMNYLGGLVGLNEGTINYSYSIVEMQGGDSLGGLVGVNNGTVNYSYSNSDVYADSAYSEGVGGLVGNNSGIIFSSYSSGSVSAGDEAGENVGGLVGVNNYLITNTYSNASVTSTGNHSGGLVGYNKGGFIYNSYSIGNVNGTELFGGLVGYNEEGIINDSFWDINTSNCSLSSGGTSKTTIKMKDVSTFTNLNTEGLNNVWDFVANPNNDTQTNDYWNIDETYPYLNWQSHKNMTLMHSSAQETSSSKGSSGGENIVVTNSNSTQQINQTENTKKVKKSSKLFDIKLELDNKIVRNLSDIESIMTFDNFGDVPTQVNLTYKILDKKGIGVYSEKAEIVVETSNVLRKKFENLNLPYGDYTLLVTTVYGDNVTDEFRQRFTLTDKVLLKKIESKWIYYLVLLIILIIGYIVKVLISAKSEGYTESAQSLTNKYITQ